MHDSLLSHWSIRELADVVGGPLRLGAMPPLGGDLEAVGPVVTDSHHVQTGDVFWALDGAGDHAARYAEIAFARDAAGAVVSGRRLEPWAGKFGIEVADTRVALWQLAAALRQDFRGSVVAVVGSETFRTTAWVASATGEAGAASGDEIARNWHPDASIRVPLELLKLDAAGRPCVLQLPAHEAAQVEAFSHLCRPEIVVINSTRNANGQSPRRCRETTDIRELLQCELPGNPRLVLCHDGGSRVPATTAHGCEVIRVGSGLQSDLVASDVHENEGLTFELDGQRVYLPRAKRSELRDVLAAFAVGRLLGKSDRRIAEELQRLETPAGARFGRPGNAEAACGKQSATTNSSEIAEASPDASGLRESDATLPPGLERFAY